MSTRSPSDIQREILAGLAAGRTLHGPVKYRRPNKPVETRKWGWAEARPVHAHAVDALAARGAIVIHETGESREARLA